MSIIITNKSDYEKGGSLSITHMFEELYVVAIEYDMRNRVILHTDYITFCCIVKVLQHLELCGNPISVGDSN